MVSTPEEVGLKEAKDSESYIIVNDLTLHNILPPEIHYMTSQYKVMCCCERLISTKGVRSTLLTWRDHILKYLKDISRNAQNRRSVEI